MLAIDRHTRDQLRDELATTLTCVGDLRLYVERAFPALDEGFASLRRRVNVALQLLDDIGWEWQDPRDVYYLTVSPVDLRWWLAAGLEAIEEALRGYAHCLELDGYVFDLATLHPTHSAGRIAAAEVEDALESADRDLDRRQVMLRLLDRLAQEGGE